jgi:D-psicose/D-tagatose/L-ribulose 3-epimerase
VSKRKFQGSSKDPVRFKYAFCNESMQGMSWDEQCDLVARSGYQGIEIAPFSLVRESVEELVPARRGKMVRALKEAGLECAGLHWLLSPPPPDLHVTTPDPEVRKRSWSYFENLIDLCGDLGGPVMVFGSPKGRSSIGGLSGAEAKKYLAEGLAGVADHAQRRGVKILLESLGQNQTDVVNTLAEAVEILEQIAHPAIQTMFDFHNTTAETEPFPDLIEKYFSRIHHVHVQEMDGRYLGSGKGATEFAPAFRKLKDRNFRGWLSVEVFDFSPGPAILALESLKTLKQIEAGLR